MKNTNCTETLQKLLRLNVGNGETVQFVQTYDKKHILCDILIHEYELN